MPMKIGRARSCRALLAAALYFSFSVLAPDPARSADASEPPAKHEVTFHLVPEAAWNDGRPATAQFLPEGRIFMFRSGSYEPERILDANRPQEVPSGDWYWIAESSGYVSVVAGGLRLAGGEPLRKTILWPVAAACQLDLSEARWNGVVRLDAVSLDRGATYPVTVKERKRLWIPAGRFLTYTVDGRGIAAVSDVESCLPGAVHHLQRPQPPPAGEQDLVISTTLPETGNVTAETAKTTFRMLERPEATPRYPTATVRAGARTTHFFLRVPSQPAEVVIEHPELLTRRLELPGVSGGVRELEAQLEPRLALVERRTGPVLRCPDGRPADRAFVLALTEDGGPNPRCSRSTDSAGAVEIPPGCLNPGQRFLLLHPRAALQPISTADLRLSGELPVQPATGLPLHLRLLDARGAPLPVQAVALRLDDGLTITPDHLIAAAATGRRFPFTTDSLGEIRFSFVTADGRAAEVRLVNTGRWLPLPPGDPGETLELVVD